MFSGMLHTGPLASIAVNDVPGSPFSLSPLPTRRYVETDSHTTSSPTVPTTFMSHARPLVLARRLSARSDSDTVSPIATGRCWVMEFSRCTDPIAGNGNAASVISAMCSGNASMCR